MKYELTSRWHFKEACERFWRCCFYCKFLIFSLEGILSSFCNIQCQNELCCWLYLQLLTFSRPNNASLKFCSFFCILNGIFFLSLPIWGRFGLSAFLMGISMCTQWRKHVQFLKGKVFEKGVLRHLQLVTKNVRQFHLLTLESGYPTVYNWNILGRLTEGKNNCIWEPKNRKEGRKELTLP